MTISLIRRATAPPEVRRDWTAAALWVGWAAQVAVRLWAYWPARRPAAFPDEAGYLLAARWLAGGPGADLSHSTFYQGGYPLLLSPVYWMTADPATAYRLVVAIGALVAAAVFPLAVGILRRLGLTTRAACTAGFAVALLPANVFFGGWALADSILPAIVAAWLLALLRFASSGGYAAGVMSSLAAAYACAVHSRGSVVLVVHAGALGFMLIRGWTERRRALAALATLTGGYAAAAVLNALVLQALYPQGARNLGAILTSRLTSADGLGWSLSGACGQLWYVVVATYGLAGVGLVAAVARMCDRWAERASRLAAGALVACTLGIALASSAALPDEHRVGNFAYGRYLACVAIPLALVGMAVLVRAGRRSMGHTALAALALVVETTLAVTAYAGDRLEHYDFIAFDFPETSYLTGNGRSLDMFRAGAVAMVLAACLMAVRRRPVVVAALVLGLNLGFVCWSGAQSARPAPAALPRGGGVEMSPGLGWRAALDLRYRVGWTTVGRLAAAGPRPGTCIAVTQSNKFHPPWQRPAPTRPELGRFRAFALHALRPNTCHDGSPRGRIGPFGRERLHSCRNTCRS